MVTVLKLAMKSITLATRRITVRRACEHSVTLIIFAGRPDKPTQLDGEHLEWFGLADVAIHPNTQECASVGGAGRDISFRRSRLDEIRFIG